MKVFYNKTKYKITLMVILAMLVQMVVPALSNYAVAESGNDLGVGIFKDVRLKIKQGAVGEEKVITDPAIIEINEGTIVKLEFDWLLEDDSEVEGGFKFASGDYAEITIPSVFEGLPGAANGKLMWGEGEDAVEVGTYTLDENNKLKVVFNGVLVNHTERKGQVWVWLKFNLNEFKDDVTQTIEFKDPINKTFTVTAKPQGDIPIISKSGSTNEAINAEYINWVIDVNTSLEELDNAIVEDTIPDGLAFIEDSIEIYDLTIGYEGTVTGETPSDKTATSFPVELGKINSAYRIKYKTTIEDHSKTTYENIATLKDGKTEKGIAKWDIGKLEIGSSIDKVGVPENPDKNNVGKNSTKITWTIDVNKAELNLNNVSVEDNELSSGLTIDNSSIKIYELTKSGGDWSQGEEEITGTIFTDSNNKKFPIPLGDIGRNAYRIVFDTSINYTEYHQSNTFTNKAVLKINEEEKSVAPAEVTVTRGTLIDKDGKELTSYGVPYIKWTIHVNVANHSITDAIIIDTIGEGLKLKQDTIKIYDHSNNDITTTKTIENKTDNGFTAKLGDINSYYKIEYETEIINPNVALKNKAELSGTGLSGDRIIGNKISKEYTLGKFVNNSYEKSTVSGKTIDDITYDGLNHNTKTMSWKITVDAIKEQITSLTIKDTFAPTGSMVFISESLKVQKNGKTVTDAVYSLTDNKQNGFALEFNAPLDRAKYEIYYKTSFDPDVVLTAGGTLNNSWTYINQAVFEGKTIDAANKEKDIDGTPKTARNDINQVVYNGGKKDGVLQSANDSGNRKIKWNIYVNALGQDLTKGEPVTPFVITDTLSSTDITDPGQEYDRTSLVVKDYTLNKNGGIEPGEVLPEKDDSGNVNYTIAWDETNHNFTLTFPNGIDKPYMVEFYTNILGISKEEYINTANISGKDLTKKYDKTVDYPNYNSFLIKDAPGVSKVYTDDEINWKLTLNESLSNIAAGAALTDTLSDGLVYVEDSLKIEDSQGNEVEYTLEKSEESGKTTLTITFTDEITKKYTVEYTTVVIAGNG